MLKEINRCIENNDMIGLRYIFLDCLDVDPTFEKYKEGYDKVKTIDGFFENYVELHPLVDEKEKWNEDYWIQLKNDLRENFSEKRFMHMRKVAKVYFSDKISKLERQRANEKIKKVEDKICREEKKDSSKLTKDSSTPKEDRSTAKEKQDKWLEERKKEQKEIYETQKIQIQKKEQKPGIETKSKVDKREQPKKAKEIALVLGIVVMIIIAIIAVLKMA